MDSSNSLPQVPAPFTSDLLPRGHQQVRTASRRGVARKQSFQMRRRFRHACAFPAHLGTRSGPLGVARMPAYHVFVPATGSPNTELPSQDFRDEVPTHLAG